MILRALAVISVAGLALSFAGTAIAQLYQRGDYICNDFKEAEELSSTRAGKLYFRTRYIR